MPKQHTEDYKMTAVRYYQNNPNVSYQDTCNIFRCSERSLKRWVRVLEERQTLARKDREQGSYKVVKPQVDFIKKEIKKDPDIFIKNLHLKLNEEFPDNIINRQYIHEIIRDNNITRKRAVVSHFPITFRGQPRDKKAETRTFFEKLGRYNLDNLISIDETAVRVGMMFSYCRNDLGKRCIMKTNSNEVFKKYSLIVAISNKKCLGFKLYEKGAVDGNRFEEFIGQIARRYRNKLFILDNAQIHKTQKIKDLMRETGNEILYTLPYSPRLNPIEQFFNQMKFYMKLRRAMTLEQLKESAKEAIGKVRTENYKNYFLYAYDRRQLERKGVSTKHRPPKIYKEE